MEPETSTARRPFDRDRDLNIKRSDPKATAKFIQDAKGLDNKFAKGSFVKKFLWQVAATDKIDCQNFITVVKSLNSKFSKDTLHEKAVVTSSGCG